jgi:hypothetical protein
VQRIVEQTASANQVNGSRGVSFANDAQLLEIATKLVELVWLIQEFVCGSDCINSVRRLDDKCVKAGQLIRLAPDLGSQFRCESPPTSSVVWVEARLMAGATDPAVTVQMPLASRGPTISYRRAFFLCWRMSDIGAESDCGVLRLVVVGVSFNFRVGIGCLPDERTRQKAPSR